MHKAFSLTNGVRVLTSPLKETQAVTVMVFVKVGSRYETQELNGASHFLEHMMFKGTQRRPNTLMISKELDGIGAEYNAFTSKDHTGYYIKTNHQHIDLALDMLSDMLVNSKFEAKELDRERGVIIEEINMYEDNPMAHIEDVFENGLYGDTPLGWNIAGKKEGITKMSREKMLAYKNKYYIGRNMWLVIAGKVPENLNQLIKKYFNLIPGKSNVPKYVGQKGYSKNKIHLQYKETEQSHLIIGGPGLKYSAKELNAVSLLAIMLGGNMSSRLFIEIRERMGLCYFIRAGLSPYEDIGHFQVQAGLDKTRIKEAIPAILQEISKMQKGDFSPEELRRAKEFIKGKFILELEDSENIAGWMGKQALFMKKIKTAKERIAEVEAVKINEVKKIAKQVLDIKNFHLAIIGPYKDQKVFEKFIN
ncbi:MAG: pitrilysin family protein [Patescibacteria group bacterium]|jgi:predicted Zn-dependent peptidase